MTRRASIPLAAMVALTASCGGDHDTLRPRTTLLADADAGVGDPRVTVREAVREGERWSLSRSTVPLWLVGGCCAVTTHPAAVVGEPGRCPAVFRHGDALVPVCAVDQRHGLALTHRPPVAGHGSDLADEVLAPGMSVRLRFHDTERGAVVVDVDPDQFTLRVLDGSGLPEGDAWVRETVAVIARSGALAGVVLGAPTPGTGLVRAASSRLLGTMLDDCETAIIPAACVRETPDAPAPEPARRRPTDLIEASVIVSGLLAVAVLSAVAMFLARRFARPLGYTAPAITPKPREGARYEPLAGCANDGLADVVEAALDGGRLYVVSDLHVARGLREGTYAGTENFFADEAFGRWLDALRARPGASERDALVLNGDVFDFLRVTHVPTRDDDLARWWQLLAHLDAAPAMEELRALAHAPDARRYGLHTEDLASAWKLYEMRRGHAVFFAALARWLDAGRRLYVTRGNHDLEWHWAVVRRCFLWSLAEERCVARDGDPAVRGCADDASDRRHGAVFDALRALAPRVHFASRAVVFDGRVHVEHGNLFDPFARVSTLYDGADRRRLMIPPGSEFNRYVLNGLEHAYPYLDNVRPNDNVVPLLLRERFSDAMALLARAAWRLPGRILRQWRFALLGAQLAAVLVAPTVLFLWIAGRSALAVADGLRTGASGAVLTAAFASGLQALVLPAFGYALARLIGRLYLREPASLDREARAAMRRRTDSLDVVTFGHTHNPEVELHERPHYFNTGTWIPIVELSIGDLRADRAYTFLDVSRDADTDRYDGRLCRWNDDAARVDPVVLVTRR